MHRQWELAQRDVLISPGGDNSRYYGDGAVLPTRTHDSIVNPGRADADNQDDMVEIEEEKQQIGKLILEALACDNFDQYRAIRQRWEEISEQTAKRCLDEPDSPQADCGGVWADAVRRVEGPSDAYDTWLSAVADR